MPDEGKTGVSTSRHYGGAVEDEVDRLVEAWQRERPDLDVAPLGVLSRVTRLARHLDRARRPAFAEHTWRPGSSTCWPRCVAPGGRTSCRPACCSPARWSPSGTMTNRIDRLEARGLVDRRSDPDDRRGVLVRLTDDGRQRVDAALSDLLEHERTILGDPSADQRDVLADLLRVLVSPFDAEDTPAP